MGIFAKIFKKPNNTELLRIIEEYKSFPGFDTMLDTINLLSDIQTGKVTDDDISIDSNSGKIRIHYHPNKSEPNYKGLTLSTNIQKSNSLLACVFESNTSDLSTCTSKHARAYNLTTKVEEARRLTQFDPHTFKKTQEETFVRHDTDVEKVIHTRYDQNSNPIIHDTLDISHSPCDIASLDACSVDDTGLFNMRCEGKTDSWAIVHNKIQESVCKAGLCARIKANNDLRKFDMLGNMFGQTDYSDKEILSIEGSRRSTMRTLATAKEMSIPTQTHHQSTYDNFYR